MPEIAATQPRPATGAASWRRVTKADSDYGGFFYTLECGLQFYFSRKITSWPCAWCGPSKDYKWPRKSMGDASEEICSTRHARAGAVPAPTYSEIQTK